VAWREDIVDCMCVALCRSFSPNFRVFWIWICPSFADGIRKKQKKREEQQVQ
jgi:hypothetical protein